MSRVQKRTAYEGVSMQLLVVSRIINMEVVPPANGARQF